MIDKNYESIPLRDVEGLPIGVPREEAGGELVKQVSFIPWGWTEEKAIAKAKEDAGANLTMTQIITETLKLLLNKWGPYNFQDLNLAERELRIRNSFFADVFYAYVKLRIEAMGELLTLPFQCPRCNHNFTYEGDLRELDVYVADPAEVVTLKDAVRRFNVAPPMRIGDELCNYVDLRPMRWEAAHNVPGDLLGTDDPRFRAAAFQDSVMGAENVETHGAVLMIEERMQSLRKIDIERLASMVDEVAGGPDLGTKLKCPDCRFEFRGIGDWSYDHFFGSSSLPTGQ